jgi:hypothetical protein
MASINSEERIQNPMNAIQLQLCAESNLTTPNTSVTNNRRLSDLSNIQEIEEKLDSESKLKAYEMMSPHILRRIKRQKLLENSTKHEEFFKLVSKI